MTEPHLPWIEAALRQRRRRLCGLAAAAGITGIASGLAGCANPFAKAPPPLPPAPFVMPPPPPPPPAPPPRASTLTILMMAASGVNPDARKRPSPVVVRMYELKASAGFESADFLSLFEKDQAALGGDLLQREELILQPGETRRVARPLGAETKFIGVLAAFRDLERARWRALVPVLPNRDNVVAVQLDAVAVVAQVSST